MNVKPTNGSKFVERWVPVIAAGAAVLIAIGSFFKNEGVSSTTIANLQADVGSLRDRANRMGGEVGEMKVFQARQEASDCQQFAKIETQFGSIEDALNEFHVADVRKLGALDLKVFGEQEPAIYYPISIPHELFPCGR